VSAPPSGAAAIAGTSASIVISAKSRIRPVRWYTHTPSANDESCVPTIDTNCPAATTAKARSPRRAAGPVTQPGSTSGVGRPARQPANAPPMISASRSAWWRRK
jgi:hypothetical protein